MFAPHRRRVSTAVEDAFGFAETVVVSFEDLYGSKIVAALDRQHPRDLFDIKQLYENEGLTDDLFRVFLVYLASSSRPPHELLNPNLRDLETVFTKEFDGMTALPVTVSELEMVRDTLIQDIKRRLSGQTAQYRLQDPTQRNNPKCPYRWLSVHQLTNFSARKPTLIDTHGYG